MKLREILSVPGMSGLYKIVAQAKNNLIIESLADGKRHPVSTTSRVTSLGEIGIYTQGEEMPLREVLKKISEADGGTLSVDPKAADDVLKAYFKNMVPDIDLERVHVSHMKKILNWYLILKGKIDFTKDEEEGDGEGGGLPSMADGNEKPIVKTHEMHAPKADQHAKVTPVKLRKKV